MYKEFVPKLFSLLKEFSKDQYSAIPLKEKCLHHEKLFNAIKNKNKKLAIAYEESSFLESMFLEINEI